jgi:3-methyladenine DNA glycosylase AlkD
MHAIDAMLALAQRKSWWDSVDGLAAVVGDVLRRQLAHDPHAQACMDAALEHENLWVRRIAMLHQLGWREDVDVTRLRRYASVLASERDFFIRKAIGWALRDFARHDPEAVRAFLRDMEGKLSPLSAREAAKHL